MPERDDYDFPGAAFDRWLEGRGSDGRRRARVEWREEDDPAVPERVEKSLAVAAATDVECPF